MVRIIIEWLSNLSDKINNMTDKEKVRLGYIVMALATIGLIVLSVSLISMLISFIF